MNNYEVLDIELELSTLCQAECPLCYRNYKSFDTHYPEDIVRPLNEIQKQIELYSDLEWVRLVGSISEPTLYPEFIQLVKFIKSKNINIEICTNGSTRNEKFWKDLALSLSKEDKVYFTICGSTQKLHEKYRKNTSLEKILKNARTFRKYNSIDYAQCIRFDYNDEDFNSKEFIDMVSEFTNIYWTETFLLKDKFYYKDVSDLDDLKPFQEKRKQYEMIEKIASKKFKEGNKRVWCKAYEEGRLQIDIKGNEYPCYLFLEASGGKEWDKDWSKIHSLQYECCKFCEESVVQLCDELNLDYII